MTFIILTGGIDLSVGSILGTTAVAAMVVSLIPAFALLSIPAALMLGLLLGLFNGALVAFAGLPPLSSPSAPTRRCRGAAHLLADGTTVINSDISFEWIGNDYLGPVPWLVSHRPGGDRGVLVYPAPHHPWGCISTRWAATSGGAADRHQSLAGAAVCLWHRAACSPALAG